MPLTLAHPVKAFDDLTHDELIALDESQINFYIDRACAEAGVPLVAAIPPVPPEIEQVRKTVAHFVIAGLRFADEADARKVAAAIADGASRRDLQYVGGQYRWSAPQFDVPAEVEAPAVTTDYVFDAPSAARQKAIDDEKGDKKKAYEVAKKEYDAGIEGRERVAQNIRSTVSKAWALEHRRRRLLEEYQRYVPLANGDEQVAKRFLQRAHADARDVLPELYPATWNDEPARAVDAQEDASGIPF